MSWVEVDSNTTAGVSTATLPFVNVKDYAYGNGLHSTIGTDDTANILAAIVAAQSAALSITTTDTPAAGTVMGTQPAIYFPAGIYDISGEISLTINSLRIIADSGAIIRQSDPTKSHFVFNGAYDIHVTGLRTMGGKRHYDLRNQNVDTSMFRFIACDFQNSADYAIYTKSNLTQTAAQIVLSAGTITGSAASQTLTGTGTAFASTVVGQYINITSTDEVYRVIGWNAGAASTLIVTPPLKTAASASAFTIIDAHMSANLLVDQNSKFINCKRVLHNVCDQATIRSSWVKVASTNYDNDTAVFMNIAGLLRFDEMFGVPTLGAAASISKARWVDLAGGHFHSTNSRFGGENSGIPIVYLWSPYVDTYPFASGANIVIEGSSQFYCGPSGGAIDDHGAIHLRSSFGSPYFSSTVPQFLSIKNNIGHSGTPVIQNSGVIDLTTGASGFTGSNFVSNGATVITSLFQYDLGRNQTASDTTVIPVQLMRFLAPETAYAALGPQYQDFVLELIRTAGAIQHAFYDDGVNKTAVTMPFADKIVAQSSTRTTTPQVAAGVAFANGGGVDAAATSDFVFNTTNAQVTGNLPVAYVESTTTGAAYAVEVLTNSINVNGTTQRRIALRLRNPTSGAAVPITTATFTVDAQTVRIRIRGFFT